MLDQARQGHAATGDFVEFFAAGTSATGAYHCSACGYGVTVHGKLPQCPMCGGTTWEPNAWAPFSRGRPVQDEG